MMFTSLWPQFTTKNCILSTSFSGIIHTVGIMCKKQLSIHRNGLAMTFVILSFLPEVLRPFVLFLTTTAIVPRVGVCLFC